VTLLLIPAVMVGVTYLLKKSNVTWMTSSSWGITAGAFLLLTAPVFMGMSAWWGVPVTGSRIFLGGGQLYSLLAFAAGCALLLWRMSPYIDCSQESREDGADCSGERGSLTQEQELHSGYAVGNRREGGDARITFDEHGLTVGKYGQR
jgi:hypothetical protein